MATRGLHIIYLYADSDSEWNCSEWRALSPSSAINAEHEAGRSPHTAQLFYLPSAIDWRSPQVEAQLGRADVLVYQRNVIVPEIWESMRYWRRLGKLVAVDIDDHYPGLPPSNPAHQYWILNRGGLQIDPVQALTEGMKSADCLTSPSKVILADWEHVVPGYWAPNWTRRAWYAPLEQKPIGAPDIEFTPGLDGKVSAAKRPDSDGLVILGWGGSISHVDSWVYSGILEALDRVFADFPQARLKFCGGERRLNDIFERWGNRVIRQTGVSAQDWPSVVSTFDVGLAPLDKRPLDPPWRDGAPVASYDERRSWLKGVEYLSAGVPWVATDCLTYADLRRWGSLVENTPDAWYQAIADKIKNLPAQKALAADRRRWAIKNVTFEPNVNRYADTLMRALTAKAIRQGERLPGVKYVSKPQPAAAAA